MNASQASWSIRLGRIAPRQGSTTDFACIAWATPHKFWDADVLSLLIEFSLGTEPIEPAVLGWQWNANWRAVAARDVDNYYVAGDLGVMLVGADPPRELEGFSGFAVNSLWSSKSTMLACGRYLSSIEHQFQKQLGTQESEPKNLQSPAALRRLVRSTRNALHNTPRANHGFIADLSSPTIQTLSIGPAMYCIDGLDVDRCVMVGEQGTVLKRADNDWIEVDSVPTNELLTFVRALPLGQFLLAGETGSVLLWDGLNTWTPLKTPTGPIDQPIFRGAAVLNETIYAASDWAGLHSVQGDRLVRLADDELKYLDLVSLGSALIGTATDRNGRAFISHGTDLNTWSSTCVELDFQTMGIEVPQEDQ